MAGNASVEYSINGLKRLIDEHEAVSFDIFDTLVMRNVYFNHDVFRIVAERYKKEAPDFFTERVKAERELSVDEYPYMEQIYDRVSQRCGLCNELKDEIMRFEVSVERQVIVARKEVVEVFNYCKNAGKRLFIVSDMYIHKEELEDIINRLGIVGYDKIFVSCEYKTSKPQRLFEAYLKEVEAKSLLHVGDSYACDIAPAEKLGINTFRLMTAAEIWEGVGGVPSADLCERIEQAKHICEKYNSPFKGEER